MKACFRSTDIFLPRKDINMNAWSVVACDQYTSQEDYWKDVENIVKDQPSTLNIIYPEVYLGKDDDRIQRIQKEMLSYVKNDIIEKRIKDGFVFVERQLETGTRLGLVGIIDLEAYDFTPGSHALIRATEGTIQSRIPPRLRIREGALLECPHVMVLIDDRKCQLIEPLQEMKDYFECVYDTPLMLNGGHIKGYAIQNDFALAINDKLKIMEQESNGFFLAVGDGNHSLATAKAYWEKIKEKLNDEDKENHPARYAMVELVNLHSPALVFEPIHRVLFHVDFNDLFNSFKKFLTQENISYTKGDDIIFVDSQNNIRLKLENTNNRLPVDILQQFLDHYLEYHPDSDIDYVHGQDAVEQLSCQKGNCGILLGAIDKNTLFPAIAAGGVLPRKTFSMGEAYEKRYYVECRQIMK
ncbi:MAG: DUF1015 domain-containing protein [Faecalibacillus sp.]